MEKVVNMFEKLSCNISSNHIENCHRVNKKITTVIIKFSRRKDCHQVWAMKKDLHKMKMEDVDLPGQNEKKKKKKNYKSELVSIL